jgi:uncharacterized protein (TIGR02597 family)
MRKNFFIVLALVWAFAHATASAQSSVSVSSAPQGMVTLASLTQGATVYLSNPLSNPVIYSGAVNSVAATTLTVTGAPFTSALGSAAAPYFVRMLSGNEAGRMLLVTGNTSNSVTVNTNDNTAQETDLTTSGFTVNPGDTFDVEPANTLASVFGANTSANPLNLTGGASFATADWVNVFNPSTATWQTYYFDTGMGYWAALGSTTNANNTVLYPYSSLSVTCHSAKEPSPTIVQTGTAAQVPVLLKSTGGNATTYLSSGYAVAQTFSQLNLGPNWHTGSSTATADVVSVWNSATRTFLSYYQTPDSIWRLSSNATADQSATVIPACSCLAIEQHTSASGAASYLPSALPYSVTN